MNGKLRIDWIGCVIGIAVGLVVWLFVHENSYRMAAEAVVSDGAPGAVSTVNGSVAATKENTGGGASASEGNAGNAEAGTKTGAAAEGKAATAAKEAAEAKAIQALDRLKIKVYLSEEKRVESVSLEQYVRGVVAAELPLAFEPEAMAAQALAARTYIVRRLLLEDRSGLPETGTASEADVTDTVSHQVYKSLKAMQKLKESDAEGWSKIDRAVERTKGEVIVYEGEPIQALYFASSNGRTENSEDVFPAKVPYLRSVDSPWDRTVATDWKEESAFGLTEFYRKIGVESIGAAAGGNKAQVRILDLTAGGRVKELLVGDERIPGAEVREKLGLRSAAFSLKLDKKGVRITTYGNGHGVGMSQWGAEGMAEQGMKAEQIVEYYYKGVGLAGAADWMAKLPL
ncbi:stage II sporulation protein D [Cohnella fermenti]|uniref:Stage II sporulation protein D n=1 Tax=Cohnella fermenti TaxID=2565925 RepID=A0A4S4BFL8_9BACL|nr:stage II sporulation protein D [Cohnella fermenti]THF73135.1 stage II sporulation protein D [Cohnella fermenti]